MKLIEVAHAATTATTNQFQGLTGKFGNTMYGSASVTNFFTTFGLIINVLLSLMGLLVFFFIIVGGFYWMTAAGDTKQVQKAKDLIRNSIIGLLVILSSLAISSFLQTQLIDRVNPPATKIDNIIPANP